MNKTKTPTINKKTFPLRLSPATYKQIWEIVQKEKSTGNYAYSINEFLTKIIEDSLSELTSDNNE